MITKTMGRRSMVTRSDSYILLDEYMYIMMAVIKCEDTFL